MKKLIGILAFVMVPALLFAQQNFIIKGHVNGINSPAKAYLRYRESTTDHLDSAVFNNGSFGFKGSVADVTYATILINPDGTGVPDRHSSYDYREIYLTAGTTILASKDSLSNAKITGTKVNEDFAKYIALLAPFAERNRKLATEYEETDKAHQDQKAYVAKIRAIRKERDAVALQFIKENPDHYFSLLALINIAGFNPDTTEIPVFDVLSPELKTSKAGKKFDALLKSAGHTEIGDRVLDFKMNDVAGKPVKLSDFKGKYVLLDFWASWCVPCRQENPGLVKAYNEYKDKNFTVLSVSLDSKKENWLKAIQNDHLNWTNVSDLKYWDNDAAVKYGVNAVPINFLIDPNGKIIAKYLNGESLENKLKELLN